MSLYIVGGLEHRPWIHPNVTIEERLANMLAGRDSTRCSAYQVAREIRSGDLKPTRAEMVALVKRLQELSFDHYIRETPALNAIAAERRLPVPLTVVQVLRSIMTPCMQHPHNWPHNLHY